MTQFYTRCLPDSEVKPYPSRLLAPSAPCATFSTPKVRQHPLIRKVLSPALEAGENTKGTKRKSHLKRAKSSEKPCKPNVERAGR
ncbi:hypothetical protein Trydic_g3080 [Trypoxylus dichotomus]